MSDSAAEAWDWPLIRKRCAAEAYRILRGRQDAEEVAQEALVRAWRSRRSCRTPDSPMPWCLQITRNEALRLLGQRKRGPTDPLPEDIELEDQHAHRDHERTVARIDVNRALRQLSLEEREVIALRYSQDYSHPQIAARLEIPEATARVRLHRAQKRLRSLLEDRAQR
jgi:RNA polymerase sigma-70 factor (ECF subfamily)